MNREGKDKKYYEERNLRFYKLMGQNYEVLINAILRGKDIYYEVPKEYQLNTKKPYILDWLMDYGRPSEISKVRAFGPVKLLCVYNALMTWMEQNPSDEKQWVYRQEWEDYYKDNPKAFQKPKKPKKKTKKVEEPKPIEVVIPEMNFFTKKGNFIDTDGTGQVFISIVTKKIKEKTSIKLMFHFRNKVAQKFESDYIVFARYENKIYFKESNLKEGFKITKKNQTSAVITPTIREKDVPLFEPFCKKELDFKYDEIYKMYYVEIKEEER